MKHSKHYLVFIVFSEFCFMHGLILEPKVIIVQLEGDDKRV